MRETLVTLVLGGTRSGKSEVAERRVGASGRPVTYLATGLVDPGDDDFAARVAAHRARRPEGWSTVEAGDDLPAQLAAIRGAVLLDSLGAWVARHRDFEADGNALAEALRARTDPTIVVSEEVGMGVHAATEIGRHFTDALGSLNQVVAEAADEVLLVVAGRVLPLQRDEP